MQRSWQRINEFLFRPDTDKWLTLLRIGLGLEITLYCLSLRNDWVHLFAGSGNGLISRDLTEAISTIDSPCIPILSWLVELGNRVGLSEPSTLTAAWTLLFGAGCFLVLGLFSRSAAVAAWFLHLCAVKSADFMAYGMDNFTTIGLFYLMLAPLPDGLALDSKIWKARKRDPAILGFHRRVLQIHMCVIYFFSGLTKALGTGWWTGAALWRALTRPPFNIISPELLVPWRHLLPALGILVFLIEVAYPLFIWPKRSRAVWIGAVVGMHVGIGVMMGLYLFALIMIVLNLAAFAPGIAFIGRRNTFAAWLGRDSPQAPSFQPSG